MKLTMLDFINITQMEILGIDKQYLYYSLLGIISVTVSLILYLIIVKLIMKRYAILNLYIISSLVAIVLTINVPHLLINIISLQTVLQFTGMVGYVLACYLFVHYMTRKST